MAGPSPGAADNNDPAPPRAHAPSAAKESFLMNRRLSIQTWVFEIIIDHEEAVKSQPLNPARRSLRHEVASGLRRMIGGSADPTEVASGLRRID